MRQWGVIREFLSLSARNLRPTWHPIIPGLLVRETIELIGSRWRRLVNPTYRYCVELEIIDPLPLGKIWVARFPLKHGYPDLGDREDLFRRGRLRRVHEERWFGAS